MKKIKKTGKGDEEIVLKALSEELNIPQDEIKVLSYEKIKNGPWKEQINYEVSTNVGEYKGRVASFYGPPCVISMERTG